ncbi:hypothetical protein FHU30_006188 [Actinomadura rupiterrae]|nr:metallophosphoesterase family protein [Actinomadura rupiterrae]MCP2340806.1 hypothetical protein [Actinomadura rupiterrae]
MVIARRSLLTGSAVAATAAALGAGPRAEAGVPSGSPMLQTGPGRLDVPGVTGLHLQFGSDPSSEMVVSWIGPRSVRRPRVRYGSPEGGLGRVVDAETRTYRDGLSGQEVYVQHARLTGLRPGTTYMYAAEHDGTAPETGAFTTAPRGRSAFTFTSFGDQGAPNLRRSVTWPSGGTPSPTGRWPLYTSSQAGTQASADIVAAIERVSPLFNLVNGDLCYANGAGILGLDRAATWADWFIGNSRSARVRPWMPCVGNSENEKGNGPIGLTGYQAYYSLPRSAADDSAETRGLWYGFTVGSVHFISLANDDVAIQDSAETTSAGTRAVRSSAGWSRSCGPRGPARTSTGSWCSCTTRWSPAASRAAGATSASGRRGGRCSTGTASIWCCAGTSTTTSGPCRCAASCRTTPGRPSRCRRAPTSPTRAREPST